MAGTVTELEAIEFSINPGRKIQAHDFVCRNYYLHATMKPAVMLVYGLMESDSNNSLRSSSAREVRSAWAGWNVVREEWNDAKMYRDSPMGRLEEEHHLLIPTPNERASIPNAKVSIVVDAICKFISVVHSLDSSSMQTWVGASDEGDVEACMAEVEAKMLKYFGTGEGDSSKGYNTGLYMPLYQYGVLKPDLDLDSRHDYEPSTESPRAPYPDVPDAESAAPRPGANVRVPSSGGQ